jgi:uncharacterized RDD family membrane protein YckC
MPPPGGGYQVPQPAYGYAPQATYGGFWVRVVAYVIDFVIITVVEFMIGVGIGIVIGVSNPTNPQQATSNLTPLLNGIGAAISLLYFAGFWSLMGATLGQRVMRLRVVDANSGQPISIGKAVLRWVGLVISFLACFVGVIWVAFDARKQGWMDKIANTFVLQG